MKQKVIAPIVYGIMWASSYTTAQTILSQLKIDEFPTYIVIEMGQNKGQIGESLFDVNKHETSIYKDQLELTENTIVSLDITPPTHLLHEMDAIGYAVDDVYASDKESDKTGFIFKKKINALQVAKEKKALG